jgi:hypothetical protein
MGSLSSSEQLKVDDGQRLLLNDISSMMMIWGILLG